MNFDNQQYEEFNNIDNNMNYNQSNSENSNNNQTLPYLAISLILALSFCSNCFRVNCFKNNRNVKKIKLSSLNNELIEDCSICLNSFSNDDNITCLPCNHYYHTTCINEWFKRSNTCPKCRIDLI